MADYQGALTGQQIDALPGLIAAEKTRAEVAEGANAAAIAAEEQRAQAAEQANSSAITSEETRATAAEAANAAAIAAEVARAEGAEGVIADKVELDDKLTAALLALLERRVAAIEESVKNGFASLIVDNLSVKVGMKAYMFNGEDDDDALVVVRAYAPNFIPKCYAQRWFDTAAKKWYKPTGLTSISDWVVDN